MRIWRRQREVMLFAAPGDKVNQFINAVVPFELRQAARDALPHIGIRPIKLNKTWSMVFRTVNNRGPFITFAVDATSMNEPHRRAFVDAADGIAHSTYIGPEDGSG